MLTKNFPVHGYAGVRDVKRWAREIAREIGFDNEPLGELEHVVTELATNLMVHRTIHGEIILRRIFDSCHEGIEIVARDRGPGIPDVKSVVNRNQSDDTQELCGLSVVKNLMDEFDIYSFKPAPFRHFPLKSTAPLGTVVTTRKWVSAHKTTSPFTCSAICRPFTDDAHNSNACFVDNGPKNLLVAVADGLEHSVQGHEIAEKTIACVRENHDLKFSSLLSRIQRITEGKQKAAFMILRINFADRIIMHAGAGNVKARLFYSNRKKDLPTAGQASEGRQQKIAVNRIRWPHGAILTVFSNGLSDKWNINDIPGYRNYQETMLNNLLIREHGLKNRDATVVVAKTK